MINHRNSSLKLECNTSNDKMEAITKNSDDEIESSIETLEIRYNPESLKGIEEELQDIKEGRTSTFDEFLSKHGYDAAILELRSNESSRPLTEYLAEKDK